MRKLIDKLMLSLGYFPKHQMEGKMLIVDKEKFELRRLRCDESISFYEMTRTGISLEKFIKIKDEDVKYKMGEFVFNIADKRIMDIQEDAHYRIRYEAYVAVRIK